MILLDKSPTKIGGIGVSEKEYELAYKYLPFKEEDRCIALIQDQRRLDFIFGMRCNY